MTAGTPSLAKITKTNVKVLSLVYQFVYLFYLVLMKGEAG